MTHEKDMTLSQQLGFCTVKNIGRIFLDRGYSFQVITTEIDGEHEKPEIRKTFTRIPPKSLIDNFGESVFDDVTDIEIRLYQEKEAEIFFFNAHDESVRMDCFQGFDYISGSY